ncbi:MAG: glutathione peroxidase [Bdellovibrionota bacterium]|mgnify:FL=1
MPPNNFFDFTVKSSELTDYNLSQHKGKVVLVVNVASKCSYTPQYKGLEELYLSLPKDKFVILGFPCNQFGSQEPGTENEIQKFCSQNYNVTFPVLAKINVNGTKADPVYQFMKKKAPGLLGTELIKWNFTKFLIGKDGQVLKRYGFAVEPSEIKKDIEGAILMP